MNIKQNIKVAVDAVVFGYSDRQLHILLIQQKFGAHKNCWALPGGFVKDTETLDEAVVRELKEETGVKANYLEQLYTFGAIDRDTRARVLSVAYLALINPKNYTLKADTDAKDAQWFAINDIPDLAFDHNDILQKGLKQLKAKIHTQPIGFELLYQIFFTEKIDRRNFRKKILSFNILKETNKIHQSGSGRPAKLFKFNKKKYKELERSGFHFEIKFA